MERQARLAAGAVFVPGAIAGAGMRSRASRDAFPSGAWERHRFNGGVVAVWTEGGCGSMCWPVDQPATHAAAGAAARGALIFCFGDSFTCSGAPIRRRHAAGATRPRPAAGQARINALFVFWFCGGAVVVCSEGRCGGSRRSGPLAREIPDIFLPLARNENSGMTMIFLPLRINALCLGGSHRP